MTLISTLTKINWSHLDLFLTVLFDNKFLEKVTKTLVWNRSGKLWGAMFFLENK